MHSSSVSSNKLFARHAGTVKDELQKSFQETGKCSLKDGDIALIGAALAGTDGKNGLTVSLLSLQELLTFLINGSRENSNDQDIAAILNLVVTNIAIIERRNSVNYGVGVISDFLTFLETQFATKQQPHKDAVVNAFLSTKLAMNLSSTSASATLHSYNLVRLFSLYPNRQSELLDVIGLETFLKRLILGVMKQSVTVSPSLARSALRKILPCVTDDKGQGNSSAIFQDSAVIKKICDGIAAFALKAPTDGDNFNWGILHEIITAAPQSSSTATAAPASGMTLFSSPQRPATVSAMETVQAHIAALRELLPTLNATDRVTAIEALSALLGTTASKQELK